MENKENKKLSGAENTKTQAMTLFLSMGLGSSASAGTTSRHRSSKAAGARRTPAASPELDVGAACRSPGDGAGAIYAKLKTADNCSIWRADLGNFAAFKNGPPRDVAPIPAHFSDYRLPLIAKCVKLISRKYPPFKVCFCAIIYHDWSSQVSVADIPHDTVGPERTITNHCIAITR